MFPAVGRTPDPLEDGLSGDYHTSAQRRLSVVGGYRDKLACDVINCSSLGILINTSVNSGVSRLKVLLF